MILFIFLKRKKVLLVIVSVLYVKDKCKLAKETIGNTTFRILEGIVVNLQKRRKQLCISLPKKY